MCVVTGIPNMTQPSQSKNMGTADDQESMSVTRTIPHTPCFTEGTEIATDRGAVRIEDLRVGDRVLTRDNGYREIHWIGARRFDAALLADYPELRPIRIPAGALAPGMPARDLTVSPQHRVLLTGDIALELGRDTEILAAAVDVADHLSAVPVLQDSVIYYHILFDAHEIVWANGCWSESFHPAAVTLDGLHAAQRDEILKIFPELETEDGLRAFAPARAGLYREPPRLELVA
jgi:hypothetical protein